jgi:hypothetical protein
MYAASKIWTRTSLQSTHKVSCMNPSLQILHSPSTVYVLFLFCEIPSKLLIPQFGEKNTLSSSPHQQPPMYAALILSFSQNKISYETCSIRNNLFGSSAPFQLCLSGRFSTLLNPDLSDLEAGRKKQQQLDINMSNF